MSDGTAAGARSPARSLTERIATVAAAVQTTAATRRLSTELATVGVPVLVLRGPVVQARLLGSDSTYRSADIDLLIRPEHRRAAFGVLEATGWEFLGDNGVLWRLDRAAAFRKAGVTVDLHWGLHAHTVSARHLRTLEAGLWAGAHLTTDGWHEPGIEPLLVYLAVHGAASSFHKPESLILIEAAARLVSDWARVEALATEAHVLTSVSHALGAARGEAAAPLPPLFDGRRRQVASQAARWLRAQASRPGLRAALRTFRRRRRKL